MPLLSSAPLPGITTTAKPYEYVCLRENGTENTARIGQYAPGGMRSCPDGFISLGIPALRRAASSKSPWILADELGFLENDCPAFCQTVFDLLDDPDGPALLGVIRKQDTPFLSALLNRPDAFVYDLDCPVLPVGCVVMASGEGRRFGSNKLLEDFNGAPLFTHILSCISPVFSETVVVTRHVPIVRYCEEHEIPVLLHNLPGQNDTIRLGLKHLLDQQTLSGCMFCTADQPLMTAQTLETLVLCFSQNPAGIYRTAWEGHPGNPVLFHKAFFPALLNLPEDTGGSVVIKKHPAQVTLVPTPDADELYDIDTPADLTFLKTHKPCKL
jgi:molybdenum cofactor cytidylyltransferase